MITAYGT